MTEARTLRQCPRARARSVHHRAGGERMARKKDKQAQKAKKAKKERAAQDALTTAERPSGQEKDADRDR